MAQALTDALSNAQSVIGLLGPGLITIAALMTGVGLIIRFVSK